MPPMSERSGTPLLTIFLAIGAGMSLLGLVGLLVTSWVLNKSFEAVVEMMLMDTGIFAAEVYEEDFPEDAEPSPLDEPDFEAAEE